jgi:hypothetical protein
MRRLLATVRHFLPAVGLVLVGGFFSYALKMTTAESYVVEAFLALSLPFTEHFQRLGKDPRFAIPRPRRALPWKRVVRVCALGIGLVIVVLLLLYGLLVAYAEYRW